MPGPQSKPRAKTSDGRVVSGKTALARLGLKSGQGFEFDRTSHNTTWGKTDGNAES